MCWGKVVTKQEFSAMLAEQPEIKHLVTRIQDALMQLYAMTRVGLDYVTIQNRILKLNF